MKGNETLLCVTAIIEFEQITYSYKDRPCCSFKAAKVKDLFPLCGSLSLSGFCTVKVKGFVPTR